MKLKETKSRVRHLLKNGEPVFKDNLNRVVAEIWLQDCRDLGHDPKEISGNKMLYLLARGKLSNIHSIERNWRKLQEEYPELRGANYSKRHGKQEEVKKDLINYIHI